MDILGPIVQNVEMTIQCIKDYRNGHDVGQKSFSHHLAELGVDFPTVALVDTTDGRFKFRDKLASGVPLPLKALFLRARKLVRSASTGKINRLQHIHLSRAILHLIVCAGDIMETKFTKEDLAYVLELEA
ncbi:hypothetical protein FRC17_005358 [Serendipita sp. 399]|nr:hypothetical protein FRC17_005358 [Serendipita sp. 399]